MLTRIHLPERAVACLECACDDPSNERAQELMRFVDATTATGVVAALFILDGPDYDRVVEMTRAALATARQTCPHNTPEDPCPDF